MGDRAPNQRTFNTVRKSNREKRAKRRRFQRMLLLAMAGVVILLAVVLLVLGICSVAHAVGERRERTTTTSGTPGGDPPPPIAYNEITKQSSAISDGVLVVVNKDHVYPYGETADRMPGKLVPIDKVKVNGANIFQTSGAWQMQSEAYLQLVSMFQKYYELSGFGDLEITSGFRTFAQQDAIGSSVHAGYSDHHTGYCVAIQSANFTSGVRDTLDEKHWIYQNCHKYGFINRYPAEKAAVTGVSGYNYCFRYVGVAHATYMAANGLCLEEYVELLRNSYAGDAHLSITGADGNPYEVYYVPATGSGNDAVTTLNTPSNYKYTVSGDNVGGFIVTVNLGEPIA